jgi:hypothetical protein
MQEKRSANNAGSGRAQRAHAKRNCEPLWARSQCSMTTMPEVHWVAAEYSMRLYATCAIATTITRLWRPFWACFRCSQAHLLTDGDSRPRPPEPMKPKPEDAQLPANWSALLTNGSSVRILFPGAKRISTASSPRFWLTRWHASLSRARTAG